MKLILDINDNKATAFIFFIKSLDFVSINSNEDYYEPTKQEVLEGIIKGIKLQSAKDFIHGL